MSALHQALLRDFRRMSRNAGLESGGVECQAATTADGLNRQWFVGWLIARGATVYYDAIGNEFGLFELCPGAPYVMVGSHLDSQPRAVRFDGAYGVLAGATVCAELYRAAPSGETELTYNLCVGNWTGSAPGRASSPVDVRRAATRKRSDVVEPRPRRRT